MKTKPKGLYFSIFFHYFDRKKWKICQLNIRMFSIWDLLISVTPNTFIFSILEPVRIADGFNTNM